MFIVYWNIVIFLSDRNSREMDWKKKIGSSLLINKNISNYNWINVRNLYKQITQSARNFLHSLIKANAQIVCYHSLYHEYLISHPQISYVVW